jgi:hypothetical protein
LNIKGNSKEDLPFNLSWLMDLMEVLANSHQCHQQTPKPPSGGFLIWYWLVLTPFVLDAPPEEPLKRTHLEV